MLYSEVFFLVRRLSFSAPIEQHKATMRCDRTPMMTHTLKIEVAGNALLLVRVGRLALSVASLHCPAKNAGVLL